MTVQCTYFIYCFTCTYLLIFIHCDSFYSFWGLLEIQIFEFPSQISKNEKKQVALAKRYSQSPSKSRLSACALFSARQRWIMCLAIICILMRDQHSLGFTAKFYLFVIPWKLFFCFFLGFCQESRGEAWLARRDNVNPMLIS